MFLLNSLSSLVCVLLFAMMQDPGLVYESLTTKFLVTSLFLYLICILQLLVSYLFFSLLLIVCIIFLLDTLTYVYYKICINNDCSFILQNGMPCKFLSWTSVAYVFYS